jgi:hypothetical protein
MIRAMRVMQWNKYNTAPKEITMGYVVRVLLMAGGVWAEVGWLIGSWHHLFHAKKLTISNRLL